MKYQDYQNYIKATPYATGLEYDYAVLWLHPDCLPLGVVSLKDCKDTVVKIPRSIKNHFGKVVPVIAISGQVFRNNDNITDIILHSNILRIPSRAFAGCTNLRRITIPKRITSIGEAAFEGCTNLSDIYFEGTVDEWKEINFHNQRHEIEFGKLIPGTPVQEIEGERNINIPGNEALFMCNVHFRCNLGPEAFEPLTITMSGKDITGLFKNEDGSTYHEVTDHLMDLEYYKND